MQTSLPMEQSSDLPTSNKISLSSFLRNEPLGRLILCRWRVRPAVIAIIVFMLSLFDFVVLGTLLGHWRSTSRAIGVLDDWPNMLTSLIVYPAFWAYYVWLPTGIVSLFSGIKERLLHEDKSRQEYDRILENYFSQANSNKFRIFAIIVTVSITALTVYLLLNSYNPPSWYTVRRWLFYFYYVPKMFLLVFTIVHSVLWNLLVVFALNEFFQEIKVDIEPYHQDGAGGLAFVGATIFKISRLSLIISLFFVNDIAAAVTRGQGFFQVNIMAVLIALPLITFFSFFAPFYSSRKVYSRAKRAEISKLSAQIDKLLQGLERDSHPTKSDVDNLTSLINFQKQLLKDFPASPINRNVLNRFRFRLLSSVLTTFIGFVGIALELYGFIKR